MEIFRSFKRTALPFWWIAFLAMKMCRILFLQFLLTAFAVCFFFLLLPIAYRCQYVGIFEYICAYIGFYKIYIL